MAKPNERNSLNARFFESEFAENDLENSKIMFEAADFLNEFTDAPIAMPPDEWAVLGKLLLVNEDGSTVIPNFCPVYKMVKIPGTKKYQRKMIMERLDNDSFL
jgi:hypothetical protein